MSYGLDSFDALHDELAELSIGTGDHVDRTSFFRARLNGVEPLVNPDTAVLIFLANSPSHRRQGTPCPTAHLDDTARGGHGTSSDRCPAPASREARHAPAAADGPVTPAAGANGATVAPNPSE